MAFGVHGGDCRRRGENPAVKSVYDPIAHLYDPWSRSVIEDIEFYVEEALATSGPVVELGVGTGTDRGPDRAPRPARDRRRLLRPRCCASCRGRARVNGVVDLVDLRLGDLREPAGRRARAARDRPVPLATCTCVRTRSGAGRSPRRVSSLLPGGRLVFDVFAPGADDIAETHGRWLEREPGIFERADWDEEARTFTLRVRGDGDETAMELAWVSPDEWRALLVESGFEIVGHYGWFDRRPYSGGEDSIWVARRPL